MPQSCDLQTDGEILLVTITREERRNALDTAANHELGEVFDDFERDPAYRVAIVTGAGDKAFCAGADLKQPPGSTTLPPTPPSGFGGLTDRFGRAKPVLAAVNGAALGGGFEIALACDLIIAADHATFGLPEPKVGLAAGSGGIPRLVKEIGPKRAHSILLTGRHVSAQEGLQLGFVNEVVPRDELMAAARRWAELILACSPAALRATKAIAELADGRPVQDVLRDQWSLPALQGFYDGPDAAEGRAAFAERRAPRWQPLRSG